jgi:hypothetical protein
MGLATECTTVSRKLDKSQLAALEVLEKCSAEGLPEFRVPSDGYLLALLRVDGLATAEWAIDQTRRKAFACRRDGNSLDADRARLFCLSVAFNPTSGDFPGRRAR